VEAERTKVGLTVSACACIEKKNDDTNKLAANFFWKNVIIKNTTQNLLIKIQLTV